MHNKILRSIDPPRSFDLFDTLVFRAGLEPSSVWEDMSADFGGAAFVRARARASTDAGSTDIEAIYGLVASDLGWGRGRAVAAAEAEMAAELRALHPIVEVVRMVRDDDVVVSDMYLSADFLRRVLLEKCGLRNAVTVTLAGKAEGKVWSSFSPKPSHHFGDNPHSDVSSPRAHGIPATLVDVSSMTPGEEAVASSVHRDVALAMRFARLQCPYSDGTPKLLYDTMAAITFPFLVRTAAAVEAELRATGRTVAVLCARDCCYLFHVMRRLWPHLDVRLLFCSRVTMRHGDGAWDAYFDSVVPQGRTAMLFDMQGTGTSYLAMCERRGWKTRDAAPPLVFVSRHSQDLAEFLNIVPFGSAKGVDSFYPCEYPRGLAAPMFEAFSTALRYFELRGADTLTGAVRKTRSFRLPQEPGACPHAVKHVMDFYFVRVPHSGPDSPDEKRHVELFQKLRWADDPLPPAYVICGREERRSHVLRVLSGLGFVDVRIVAPAPADDATWKEALRLLGVAPQDVFSSCPATSSTEPFCLSFTQASHLVTYLGVLEGASAGPLFLFEDDIVPVRGEDEVALLLHAVADASLTGFDVVQFEWCYSRGGPCEAPASWSAVLSDPGPRDGAAYCCAAAFWGDGAKRLTVRARAAKMLRDGRHLPSDAQGAYPLATDQLFQSLRVAGDLDVRFCGPLFRQARERFGSNIEGSLDSMPVFCVDRDVPLPSMLALAARVGANTSKKRSSLRRLLCTSAVWVLAILIIAAAVYLYRT